MKTFTCHCGNRLFFDNVQCVACGAEVGFCPDCRRITGLKVDDQGVLHCGQDDCGAAVLKCQNYATENVCNGCVPGSDATETPLCEWCQLTDVIPDLTIEGNREKWRQLEHAKRRVLYILELLGLPIGRTENGIEPPLRFDFKSDASAPVYTGHEHGLITINIREADDVEREKARVAFKEPHRTLVGHLRHELGHYYWEVLVEDRCVDEFRQLFGDEQNPEYDAAREAYYNDGPPADWSERFISAYASMHPWEDFAETFGAYLDMISVLDTASHFAGRELVMSDGKTMLSQYQRVGIMVNELNREMGIKDLTPEVFGPAVAEKICFIHGLIAAAAHGSLTPVSQSAAKSGVPSTQTLAEVAMAPQ